MMALRAGQSEVALRSDDCMCRCSFLKTVPEMYLYMEISITRRLKTTASNAFKGSDCAGLMWPQAFDGMVDGAKKITANR